MKDLRATFFTHTRIALKCRPKTCGPHYKNLIFIFLFGTLTTVFGQQSVDHRYAPEYWYSAIGFPGDYHKTLVDEYGALLYDFGPGPYVRPNTIISFGLVDDTLSVNKQSYNDPKIPLVLTDLTGKHGRVAIKTFSLLPETFSIPETSEHKVWRTNGLTGSQAWASPPDSADPAFRTVAWGTNRPIEYDVRVEKNQEKTVVLGFCESYRKKTGLRTLELHVEGAETKRIDPLEAGPVNTPHIYCFSAKDENGDGVLDIEILSPKGDPNTLVNALWVFPANYDLDEKALISGALSEKAELYLNAGREPEVLNRPPRFDVMSAEISGGQAPVIKIKSKRRLTYDSSAGIVFSDGIAFLKASPTPASALERPRGIDLIFPPGTQQISAIIQNGFASEPAAFPKFNEIDATSKLEKYWRQDAGIPHDRIVVPDRQLQDILAASIRTFYQSSEKVDGYLQFQPGAALYRGLWMHDGVYFADLALQLGDREKVRHLLEGYLRFQHDTGQVEVMRPNSIHRETALLLWVLCRYVELTGDDAWLQARWHHVEKGVAWLGHLREQTLTPGALNYGLTPAGFADGGVGGVQPEYASVNWILIALPAVTQTARRYGKHLQADQWQQLYDKFLTSFRTAMQRDTQQDPLGNLFLPVRVGVSEVKDVPQRGQWMLLEALMHGRHLLPKDTLVDGTLAMLEANMEQGLVTSTGWLTNGIWVYYGGFLAEAYLKRGEGQKAAAIMYAMANHASPVATWPEEQMPKGKGRRTVGDYPHTWASSTMVRLAIRMLAIENDADLVLFSGLPMRWLGPGATTELRDVATRFGRLRLTLRVSEDGQEARINLNWVSSGGDGKIVIDMAAFEAAGFIKPAQVATPRWDRPFELVLRKKGK